MKVTTYITAAVHMPEISAVRAKHLAGARAASTLVVVKPLMRPEWLVEVEAVAFSDRQASG